MTETLELSPEEIKYKGCDVPYDMLEDTCPHCDNANDCDRWLRSCEERRAAIMAEIWDAEQQEQQEQSGADGCDSCRGL